MITTVIFDLGGVFVPFDFDRAWDRLREGTNLSRQETRDALKTLYDEHNRGRYDGFSFHRQAMEILGVDLAYDEFREAWCDIFRLDEETVTLAEKLIDRNFPLYLLSNTDTMHWPYVRDKFDLGRLFKGEIVSYEVGALKPDPTIYQAGIDRFGWIPESCVFIDDMPENIAGATDMGFCGVVFKSAEQVVRELAELGVTTA